MFVYNPEFDINWPNQQLGVLKTQDKNFNLPGDIGTGNLDSLTIPAPGASSNYPDILTTPTLKEKQVHALYNANDYIRYTQGSEVDTLSEPAIVSRFPSVPKSEDMAMEAHNIPTVLRKDLGSMFPEQPDMAAVITLSFHTENDMSKWSEEVESEREEVTHASVLHCKEICGRLRDEGYWADFIDPSSGTPHFSAHTNHTLFETDERYRLLGFSIEDLGCCKVVSHNKFGRHVFVATIVTNASSESDVVGNIMEEMTPNLLV